MKKLGKVLPFVLSAPLLAQQPVKMPAVSPAASVKQTIGVNDLTLAFHRPGVKGRKIWGDLVPYGKVWRTGANEATTFTATEDVLVEGKPLAAGTYALFTIPGEKEWTIVFNKDAKQWGSYDKKDAEDVLKVVVTPRAAEHEEWMSFRFRNLATDSAEVVLAWEKIEVPFTVKNKVDTVQRVLGQLRERVAAAKPDAWQPYVQAASFCYDNKVNADEAMTWVNKGLSIKSTTFGHFVKARLLEQKGKTADGVAELEAALKAAEKDESKEFLDEIKGMIASWRAKPQKA